jgi:hypothetical protein
VLYDYQKKGYTVLVIEKKKWFNAKFPKTNWNLKK